MFKFLLRWFTGGSKPEPSSKPKDYPQKTSSRPLLPPEISYDDGLIEKLTTDHIKLLHLFGEIKTAAEQENYAALPGLLSTFRLALQTHLMLENVKFYAYVQQHLEKDSETLIFINDVKREMDGIVRAAMRFSNTYKTQKAVMEKPADFLKELGGIGEALVKRVTLEETRLYTLYLPSYQ
ncbi:MAG: hemerythrin domain-containing protein [Proteobacteria bacterium]|nr:hemerythrin domain-containing protein [Pseudomonadota bacterium]